MRYGISYKQNPIEGEYDAIVIGSGLGGLSTAVLLGKEGKRVLVLEKHYTAGGFTHTFKRKDYEWDVGVHYIGEVGHPTSAIAKLFDYVTDGKLEWEDMGEVYDKIIIGEKVYNLVKGVQNWTDQMKTYFPAPADQKAIDEYVRIVFEAAGGARSFYAEKAIPDLVRFFSSWFLRSQYMKFAKRSTLDVLKELTDNMELIGVLTGQYGDYGLPPSKSSFAMHAMVAKHYFRGGFYPIGGSGRMAETIIPVIESTGGKVYSNAGVDEIIIEDNKAVGVRMEDGKEIFADLIISNAGIMNTYGHLLPKQVSKNLGLDELLNNVHPSASHVSLYIGCKHTAEELGLQKANYWIYPDNYDHDQTVENYLKDPSSDLPVVYVSFPGAKDPDFTNRFPGRTTMEIITIAPYEHFEKWEKERWKKRGEEYEAYKEEISQRLLEQLYRFEPQLRGKIDYYELSSPLSTRHFVNYQQGEIYGIDHSPERFEQKFLRPRTPIKGLYLTGQDIVTAGIGGALFSGVITASSILKKNVIGKVMNREVEATPA